jgi:hypothetical protein
MNLLCDKRTDRCGNYERGKHYVCVGVGILVSWWLLASGGGDLLIQGGGDG